MCKTCAVEELDLPVPAELACERSGAAKFPAYCSAPFTGLPLTAPFPLRRPPASLRSRSTWFFDPRSALDPLRSFDVAPAPLRDGRI